MLPWKPPEPDHMAEGSRRLQVSDPLQAEADVGATINLELPKPNFWTLPYNFLNKVLLDDPRQSRGVNRLTARLLRA